MEDDRLVPPEADIEAVPREIQALLVAQPEFLALEHGGGRAAPREGEEAREPVVTDQQIFY